MQLTAATGSDKGTRSEWWRTEPYTALVGADRTAFAWEWLRRTSAYQGAWRDRYSGLALQRHPRDFGLERFEDPGRAIPHARPVWSAAVDPTVIRARIGTPFASAKDRVDLRAWADLVTIAIDEDDTEHLLLSYKGRALRIDVLEGTLIGCPASLRYILEGMEAIEPPLTSLHRLVTLQQTGTIRCRSSRPDKLQGRWILELRAADALLAGADQQDISRALFGTLVAERRWRSESGAYRQRTQRLVRSARKRLERPLDPRWFQFG